MRSLIATVALGLGTLAVGALPASAAKWACSGGDYVCGSSARASAGNSTVNRASPAKKVRYSSNRQARNARYANRAPVRQRAYSGGGGGGSGMASYYWQPQRVASGGMFNPNALTAAHKTLPFGTKVRVTNTRNGSSVVVTINDRGPFVRGRVIDLSSRAAGVIGMKGAGVAPVRLEVLGRG